MWWRCPAGHESQETINTRLSLPRWKNGNRAACRECDGSDMVLAPYTYPGYGHTQNIRQSTRDKGHDFCYGCRRKQGEQRWRQAAAAARKSGPLAAGLVDATPATEANTNCATPC